MRVALDALVTHCTDLLTGAGLPRAAADEAVTALVDADLRGLSSHGVAMLPVYVDGLRSGGVSTGTVAAVVSDGGGFVLLDAGHALGQLTSAQAVRLVAERAGRNGVAAVGVRRAHHFGAASTWSVRLAEQGFVGVALSNSAPLMAAPGTATPVVGNNPLSVAAVDRTGGVIVADLALSVGSVAKMRATGKVPAGWALDPCGAPTRDLPTALAGSLVPLGDGKGFGLAVLVEVLTGVLTGGPFGTSVSRFSADPGTPNNCAHLFLALDPRAVGTADAVADGVAALAATLPHVPGRARQALAAEHRHHGVEVPDAALDRLGWRW